MVRVGKGVLLTATWLLPIALIPGTWFDHSFPEPPPAPPPPPALPETAPAPGGPAKTPSGGEKPEAETPTPAPVPSPPSESTPDPNPTPSPDPPASSTPVDTPPVASPTTPDDPEEDAEAKGKGKRTRKTSLTQTIASFVSRKAKIPPGLRSRKNSTSAVVPSHDNRVVAAASATMPPAAPLVAQVSKIASTSTSLTSPMVSIGGLPPAQRRHASDSSADGSGVAFPSDAGEGVQSFAALAGSTTDTTTPVVVQAGGATTPTPIPSAASTGGFVASGMLSPLTPGVAPPNQGGGYLPSPPDSPSPDVAPKSTNKLKKRNSLTSRATSASGSRPETKRKPTLGMNAVHPDSELGQELVKSWRVGTVDLPVPSPAVGKDEDADMKEAKE